MLNTKNMFYLTIAALLTLSLTSCSDDDPVSADDDLDLGMVEFSVVGDVNANLEGIAEFGSFGDGTSWEISFADTGPQTFSLIITTVDIEEAERPSPGYYEIGSNPAGEDEFTAIFNDLEDGPAEGIEYTTMFGNEGGIIEITESSSDEVSGNFSFTAVAVDQETNEIAGEIVVSEGEFTAVPIEQ
jgi:hypothetical protein